MYKYANFGKNITYGLRVLSIFTNRPRPVVLMLSKPRHRYAYQYLDNVELYKYAKFGKNIPYGSRVLSIFTNRPRPVGLMLSKASSFKNSCYAYMCQWLDNVDMHTYAKFDQTIHSHVVQEKGRKLDKTRVCRVICLYSSHITRKKFLTKLAFKKA